jgi:adenine C2-methylase RlmN of 23S rRNA A2503 and tRNA A37
MNFDAIKNKIDSLALPEYHFQALINLVNRGGESSYDQLTSWPKQLRKEVETIPFYSYESATVTTGADQSVKALLRFPDKTAIETVLIQTKPDHYSVCVSCQSGCAMGCAFCATGTLGLIRSLTAEEIADQLLFWRQTKPDIHIKSIVFMGMGEPFANQIEVFKAIDWLHTYYNVGFRHITISTCGLPAGITALAKAYPQVNLAISLHAANQTLRESLMPISEKVSLTDLSTAIKTYLSLTNRQVTFEYLLLKDVNDTKIALEELVTWLSNFKKNLTHVNLIGYNQTTDQFTKPSKNRIYFARDFLQSNRISATIRKSMGEDIVGACGQLSLQTINA